MQLFEPLCFSIGRLFRTCQSTTVTIGRLLAWCFFVKIEPFYIEHVGESRVKLGRRWGGKSKVYLFLSIVSFTELLEPIFFTFNVTNNTLMHDFTVCGLFPVRVVDGGGGGYDNSCKSGKRFFQGRVHVGSNWWVRVARVEKGGLEIAASETTV